MNMRGHERENQGGRGRENGTKERIKGEATKLRAIGGVVWKYKTTEASKLYAYIKAI